MSGRPRPATRLADAPEGSALSAVLRSAVLKMAAI
jgi:hypothetical protein